MGLAVALWCSVLGCRSTVDSLGYNDATGIVLHRMAGPGSYPNAFTDVLGKSDSEIASKLASAFQQLFHGDTNDEAIYKTVSGSTDRAYIEDVLHQDIRTEGIGLGMLIAVQMDHRDEFDRLWRYAENNLEHMTGPAQGYFDSACSGPRDTSVTCLDPYGLEHILMSLLLANDHWGTEEGGLDYARAAKNILTAMRHKQDENGGIVDGITDSFDPRARLILSEPVVDDAGITRPSIVTPGFYDLWAQAADDPFWSKAATAGRALLKTAAHPTTGLFPLHSRFDGAPASSEDSFGPEAYRTFVNVVLDRIWTPTEDSWDVDEADQVLRFFVRKGANTYGRSYSLDGDTTIDSTHEPSLVMVNGITGLIAKIDQRHTFIQAVWDNDLPTGPGRYFTGIFQMLGLLILSGQCRVY